MRLGGEKKSASIGVQKQPLTVKGKGGSVIGQIKVDAAYHVDGQVVLAGWSTAKVDLSLMQRDAVLSTREMRVTRPDVAAHFSLHSDVEVGFVLVADAQDAQHVALAWDEGPQGQRVRAQLDLGAANSLSELDQSAFGSAFGLLELGLLGGGAGKGRRPSSQGAPLISTPCPNARGYLEAASCLRDGTGGVVVGWLLSNRHASVWLEDDEGHTFGMADAFRIFRQDVLDAVGADVPNGLPESGFILRIEGVKPGQRLRLLAASAKGIHQVSEVTVGEMSADPVSAAKWLFAIQVPEADLAHRFEKVDLPLLEKLIQRKQSGWAQLPTRVHRLGAVPEQPLVSIIIPLYGRTDFVEHQMVEFACDPWLQANAEIIYVVDDPALVEPFTRLAQALFRLYKLPFTWVWGSANRGFSGANNLGAQFARAPYLNFLNSDAFPQQAGWLRELVNTLATRDDLGAIGPRLVFADGAIQHAGIQFLRREELGVWINHHPHMGMDPALDPHQGLTVLPAVTGACMVMRTADFEKVERWDTGYLIGDFEDTDLCLKLCNAGFQVGYLPSVQLTHLERQSFKLIGQSDFRSKVVIYNAARHQNRWKALIETSAADNHA